jgi:prophage regulatory protein
MLIATGPPSRRLRRTLRKPAVLAATGWSNSTLYDQINKGKFPKPHKLDPDGGRAVGWWEDEVIEVQERQAQAPTA